MKTTQKLDPVILFAVCAFIVSVIGGGFLVWKGSQYELPVPKKDERIEYILNKHLSNDPVWAKERR